ncbi:M61 family metallopeptidase [Thalassotalea fusca]
MKKIIAIGSAFLSASAFADTHYQVSFDNAPHHEAQVSVTYTNLQSPLLEVQMSRSSPGRYALHEFAKNVYNVTAVNSVGQPLQIERPNPYQWHVSGHDGEVTITYTLFGDRADGTYTQIDRTHAHMNIPASFMWATGLEQDPITIKFQPFDSKWKVATQLPKGKGRYEFTAPNLAYFMDSPIELSDHDVRSWQVTSPDQKSYTINLAVHHDGISEDVDKYADMAKAVVDEQIKLYGSAPSFDYGEYTFIACYLPHVNNDGMEHRNSTILTKSMSLDEAEYSQLSTLSHEFFHAWNVERIRPQDLEPFNFSSHNMSRNLWFAEGFTTYYDRLIMRRAQQSTIDEYLKTVTAIVNQAQQYPGRLYFTPEGASMLATFTDAGTSIDKTNFSNIFFSYYIYGRAMALALDLSIRAEFPGKSLDDYMRAMWQDFGQHEKPYTRDDLKNTLAKVLDDSRFVDKFFSDHIYGQTKPDFESLLAAAGIEVKQADTESAYVGQVSLNFHGDDAIVSKAIKVGSPLYLAGVERGDQIVKLGRRTIRSNDLWRKALAQFNVGDSTTIEYIQRGITVTKQITFIADPSVRLERKEGEELSTQQQAFLTSWLGAEKL